MNYIEPKFEYTQNNHFKWGYGDYWYNNPNASEQFKVHLGYCTRAVKSFREECINAATLIAKNATKPIIVGLSGGADSQIVCLSLREAKIPYSAVIVRLYDKDNDLINEHDIKTAYKFCEVYDVQYIEHHINIDEFYKGPGLEFSKKYGFSLLETLIQCSTMDFVGKDYCYIMGGGDVLYVPYYDRQSPGTNKPRLQFNPTVVVASWIQKSNPIMQHMVEMGYEGTSKFFMYTPELIAAYVCDPVSLDFVKAQDVIYMAYMFWHKDPAMLWRCYQLMHKPLLIMREWPEIIPARKYTGFEQLSGVMKGKYYKAEKLPIVELRKVVSESAGDKVRGQAVVLTIPELIEYITTPHENSLAATPWISL